MNIAAEKDGENPNNTAGAAPNPLFCSGPVLIVFRPTHELKLLANGVWLALIICQNYKQPILLLHQLNVTKWCLALLALLALV